MESSINKKIQDLFLEDISSRIITEKSRVKKELIFNLFNFVDLMGKLESCFTENYSFSEIFLGKMIKLNNKSIRGIICDSLSVLEKLKESTEVDRFLNTYIPAAKIIDHISSNIIFSINSEENVIPKIIIKFLELGSESNIIPKYSGIREFPEMEKAFSFIDKLTELIQFSINSVTDIHDPFILKNYFYYTLFFDENKNSNNFSVTYHRTIVPINRIICDDSATIDYFDCELNKNSYQNKGNSGFSSFKKWRSQKFSNKKNDDSQKLNFNSLNSKNENSSKDVSMRIADSKIKNNIQNIDLTSKREDTEYKNTKNSLNNYNKKDYILDIENLIIIHRLRELDNFREIIKIKSRNLAYLNKGNIYEFEELYEIQIAFYNIILIKDMRKCERKPKHKIIKTFELISKCTEITSKEELYKSRGFFELVIEPYCRKIEIEHSNMLWIKLKKYIIEILKDFEKKKSTAFNHPKYCDICLCDHYGTNLDEDFGSVYHGQKKVENPLNELLKENKMIKFCKKINKYLFISPLFTMCLLCLSRELQNSDEKILLDPNKVKYPTCKSLFDGGPNLVCKKCYEKLREMYGEGKSCKKKLTTQQKENKKERKKKLDLQLQEIPPILYFLRELNSFKKESIVNTKNLYMSLISIMDTNKNSRLENKNEITEEKESTELNNQDEEVNLNSNDEESETENINIKIESKEKKQTIDNNINSVNKNNFSFSEEYLRKFELIADSKKEIKDYIKLERISEGKEDYNTLLNYFNDNKEIGIASKKANCIKEENKLNTESKSERTDSVIYENSYIKEEFSNKKNITEQKISNITNLEEKSSYFGSERSLEINKKPSKTFFDNFPYQNLLLSANSRYNQSDNSRNEPNTFNHTNLRFTVNSSLSKKPIMNEEEELIKRNLKIISDSDYKVEVNKNSNTNKENKDKNNISQLNVTTKKLSVLSRKSESSYNTVKINQDKVLKMEEESEEKYRSNVRNSLNVESDEKKLRIKEGIKINKIFDFNIEKIEYMEEKMNYNSEEEIRTKLKIDNKRGKYF